MHPQPKKTRDCLPRALQTRIETAVADLGRALAALEEAIGELTGKSPPATGRHGDRPGPRKHSCR
ncbi:hypothetical protein SBA4_710034 [Candidatus Sulfopaludibacter sp. SbA4]|nr:hypothetical protein SBA4_710034 [Candidatus Sulfopaludibacter sp. SbA4]